MSIRRFPIAEKRRGSAFTLLEVLLAMTIGVLLLGALYVAVDLHLRHAQTAREIVEESTLARALLDRMASDIGQNIGPIRPAIPSGSGGGGAAAASTASSGATSGTGTTTSTTTTTAAPATTGMSAFQFNVGVQGDAQHLVLCTSRVPRELSGRQAATAGPVSDLRRIMYWMEGSGDAAAGLARQELLQVTSDDAAGQSPTNLPDDPALVIAGEVKDLTFSYFDGSNWQDTWDGTTVGPDGQTPIGPPVAIRISLTISSADKRSTKSFRRVVVIPTANGLPQQGATTGP